MEAAYLDLAAQIDRFVKETLPIGNAKQTLHTSAVRLLEALKPSAHGHTVQPKVVSNGAAVNGTSINGHHAPAAELTAMDLNGLSKCLFNWCDSYDHKDFVRLAGNIAPTLDLDYRALGMDHTKDISAADYLATVSSENFIGNPKVMCQHLIGCSYFEPVPPTDGGPVTEALGHHQIRAAHQVYTDTTLKEVSFKGHAHATNVHKYKKIDDVWKLAGLKPRILWSEYDFENVWAAAKTQEATNDVNDD